MTQLIYDGTFQGLLTAIYEIYALKIQQCTIHKKEGYTPNMFDSKIDIKTSEYNADLVAKKLKVILSPMGFRALWKAHLSELPEADNIIVNVVRYAIANPEAGVLFDYTNEHVIELHKIIKMVGREKHRMDAFVRFELAEDDIYYATIEPDFNVLPLCARHFQSRYADQKWLIYDAKRNYGVYYDTHRIMTVELALSNDNLPIESIQMQDIEHNYQELWRSYFKSTNIEARKNTKLHLQHVPKRYWKYLTEKQVTSRTA